MLNLPVYLYTPAIRVFIDLDNSTNLGIDDMYHGYATIAKGIKNTIRFNVSNGEQRLVSINDMTFKFKLFDQNTNTQVLEKTLNVLDDTVTKAIATAQTSVGTVLTFANTTGIVAGQTVTGTGIPKNVTVISTTNTTVTLSASTLSVPPVGTSINFVTKSLKGGAELVLVGDETRLINSGRYTYSILKVDTDNEYSPLFVDGARTLTGNIEVTDGIVPSYVASDELSFLRTTAPGVVPIVYSTGKVSSNRDGKGNDALHTAQFYYTSFTGTITVYGSLLNSIDGDNGNWVELEVINKTNQTSTDSLNLVGYDNFNFFKFEYTPVSGSVDKVLYRR